jgi:hypothetical protein
LSPIFLDDNTLQTLPCLASLSPISLPLPSKQHPLFISPAANFQGPNDDTNMPQAEEEEEEAKELENESRKNSR